MSEIKIAFVGLYNELNFGDPIIFDCTEWLYRRYMISHDFVSQRLYLDYVLKTYKPSLVNRIKNKILKIWSPEKNSFRLQNVIIEKTQEYFESSIKDYDLVVVVGGGIIKWSYQFFYAGLTALLQVGERLNVPVVLNAVGVEGYSVDSIKCQKLKSAMQLPALIHISTRDDLDTLVSQYYDGNPCRPVVRVSDPAVWVSEAYGIIKKKSKTIGIGIARGEIFQDNGIDLQPSELLRLYKEIIRKILNDGNTVEVFTNGLPADNCFADIVCEELRKNGCLVNRRYPIDPHDLVEIISSYRAIIATRLHSCIIAYSLDIPAVGLVWNDKLSLFGRNIHVEENFIKYNDFESEYIVNQLYKSIDIGYDMELKASFRQTIIDDIVEIDKKTVQISKREHLLIGGGKYNLFIYN